MDSIIRWRVIGGLVAVAAMVLALMVGASAAHAGGACRGAPVTEGSQTVVHIEGVCFSPTIVHVKPGSTVTWNNGLSKAPHTITGANASWGSFSEVAPGASVAYTFADVGVFPYYCFLHPGMVGSVVVGDENASGMNAESVSLNGGAQPARSTAPSTGGDRGLDSLWLIVPLAAATAVAMAAGGFALGTRRARH